LIVYCVFFGHVEEFIRLKFDSLIFEDGYSNDKGSEDAEGEQDIAKGLFRLVDDEERSGKESQEDVSFYDPQPRKTSFSIELETSEDEPDLVDHRVAIVNCCISPELIERFISEAQEEIGSH
jgi:hypothetical protein